MAVETAHGRYTLTRSLVGGCGFPYASPFIDSRRHESHRGSHPASSLRAVAALRRAQKQCVGASVPPWSPVASRSRRSAPTAGSRADLSSTSALGGATHTGQDSDGRMTVGIVQGAMRRRRRRHSQRRFRQGALRRCTLTFFTAAWALGVWRLLLCARGRHVAPVATWWSFPDAGECQCATEAGPGRRRGAYKKARGLVDGGQ